MRFRPRTWWLLSLLLFVAAGWMWRFADQQAAEQRLKARVAAQTPLRITPTPLPSTPSSPAVKPVVKSEAKKSLLLSNTSQTLAQLRRNQRGILLRNALIDTRRGTHLDMPEALRAHGDPGSYVVQSAGTLNAAFYAALQQSGAEYVAFIPNNAVLVRASSETAQALATNQLVSAVLPWEPYYKLDPALLAEAVASSPLTNNELRVTVFPGQRDAAWAGLQGLGASLMGEDTTPFGPSLIVRVPPDRLVAVAQMPQTQEVEQFSRRQSLNDLTRVRLGVSSDTITTNNYQNLTGTNIWVNVNDTGVDIHHPDFGGPNNLRVVGDPLDALVLTDTNGHGTHVAGIIAGGGNASTNLTNAIPGSAAGANFRGMAPQATLYVQRVNTRTGPIVSDAYLQTNASAAMRAAAGTNASSPTNGFISNNSWGYNSTVYDMAAASYDAAVRDAQPGTPGEQGMTYVFAAGDRGGSGGTPDAITSPGTAKNAITVGAIDSPRFITNTVDFTNQGIFGDPIFLDTTDNSNQVPAFSSGGNVDIGIEGPSGRFKPDVVAPGVFIVSARSTNYQDPTNQSLLTYNNYPGQDVTPGQTNYYSIVLPAGTTNIIFQVLPNAYSPVPFPGDLQVWFDTQYPPRPSSRVTTFNDAGLPEMSYPAAGTWFLGVYSPKTETHPVAYDLNTYVLQTNDYGTYYTVLSNMNSQLGPYYRYESGTSMAAAGVSGMMALMQQFLQTNRNVTASPALLYALVVNGSRPLNNLSDFNPQKQVNLEGWGLPNLANSVPASLTNGGKASLVYFDQNPTNALQTGQWHKYVVNIADTNALNYPLRITMRYTDPPGNPVAGVTLVNDLDLLVIDNTGTNVYVGNDFQSGDIFTEISDPAALDASDTINNEENVYIRGSFPALTPSYTVWVKATRVNVNAVTTQTNVIGQDYALVISSDDQALSAALTVQDLGTNNVPPEPPLLPVPLVTAASNGVPLLHQRVGGNEPNIYNSAAGTTNGNALQWHFFTFTNNVTGGPTDTNTYGGMPLPLTNAIFATFLPPTLTFPLSEPPNLSEPAANDADIDLYVTTNPALLTLDENAVAGAFKSLGRGGNETLFVTTKPGDMFYIGVKSETQQAADFAFFAVVTTNLSNLNPDGTLPTYVQGLPEAIPDDYQSEIGAEVMAIVQYPALVRKVAVTAGMEHSNPADLYGKLSHLGGQVVLNHYTGVPAGFTNIYDDLPDGTYAAAIPSDGPGSLKSFVGLEGPGQWLLTEKDNVLTHTGMVTTLNVAVFPQPPNGFDFIVTIPAHGWYYGYVDVPDDAIYLTNSVTYTAGSGPVSIYMTNADSVNTSDQDNALNLAPPGGSLLITTNGALYAPPLSGGRWFYGITNSSSASVTLHVVISIVESLTPNLTLTVGNNTLTPLLTDAHTNSQICIDNGILANGQQLVSLQVGVRIDDTNLDDLVLHLTSPQGTSITLFEDRGGLAATNLGLGTNNAYTNYTIFTEDTNLTSQLIKFMAPPYGQGITNVNVLDSSFETVGGGITE